MGISTMMSSSSEESSELDDCNITEAGIYHCPGERRLYIRNVYPPVQDMQPRVQFVVVIFVLCFIVGVCGNSSVLTIIRSIVTERKGKGRGSLSGTHGQRRRHPSSDNAILYIGALCCVDFLMSLSLPPAIMDTVIGFWMFGTAVCKLHHICGSVGRIVSTFLITAMSFDRYVAVCHPYKMPFRSRRFVVFAIAALWTTGFLLLLPMLTYAKANEVLLREARQVDPATGVENITRVRVYKCSDMMPPLVFYWFTSSTFVLGYLVPLVLIVYFNWRLVRKLYAHSKVLPKSGIPLRRISVYTILIAVVYFLCWTPYWCSVLYAIYMSLLAEGTGGRSTSELLLFIIYCVHLLPYVGSASNWILYGLLNTQLQTKQNSESTREHAQNNSGEQRRNSNRPLCSSNNDYKHYYHQANNHQEQHNHRGSNRSASRSLAGGSYHPGASLPILPAICTTTATTVFSTGCGDSLGENNGSLPEMIESSGILRGSDEGEESDQQL